MTGATISLLPSQPFYEGLDLLADNVPRRLQVGIAGHPYVVELDAIDRSPGFTRATVPVKREAQDTTREPSEASLSIQGRWRRNQSNWTGGAGQQVFDDEESASPRNRFRTSKGLEWTEKNRLSLLHSTSLKLASALTYQLLAAAAGLYVVENEVLKFSADPSVASPSWTSSDIHAGEASSSVRGITTDGSYVYAAVADGIHRTAVGASSSSHFALMPYANFVLYANGRLLAASGARLAEISATGVVGGASQLDYNHPNGNWLWWFGTAAPNGIYLSGSVNYEKSQIYYVGVDEDGALTVPAHAMSLPDGETVTGMAAYSDLMIILTTRGLRLATINANNTLTHGKAIEVPNVNLGVEPQEEFVWFGYGNYDSVSAGLAKADLGTLTDTLVPAWAPDLLAGDADDPIQGIVTGVATYRDRRYFCVSGSGVWGEDSTYVEKGELWSGDILYGTFEPKAVTALDFRHEPLNGSVEGHLHLEDESHVTAGASDSEGSLGPADPLPIDDVSGESFEVHLVLNRGDDEGPVLKRWTLHSIVTPHRDRQFEVPLILRPEVIDGNGNAYHLDPLAELQFLEDMEENGRPVNFQLGTETFRVTIESVVMLPTKWLDDYSGTQGICVVTLKTVEGEQ